MTVIEKSGRPERNLLEQWRRAEQTPSDLGSGACHQAAHEVAQGSRRGSVMRSGNPSERRHGRRVSRRRFLGGAAAGCLSLLWGVGGAAGDEKLPRPRFLLEWGRRGKGKGEF